MNTTRRFRARLLLAGVFGWILATLTWSVAMGVGRGAFTLEQDRTRYILNKLERLVAGFHTKSGAFPLDLASVWSSDPDFAPRDGWGKPFVYSIQKNDPLIESLGRDGARGGVGLDADLSNQNLKPREANVPLLQKLEFPVGQGFALLSLLVGAVGFWLVSSGLKPAFEKSKPWPMVVMSVLSQFAVAVLVALFGAFFIALAHIPSGH